MKLSLVLAAWLLLPAALIIAEVPPQKTVLDCDRAEIWSEGNETHGICTGSVTLVGTNVRLVCDRLEFIALGRGDTTSTLPPLERFRQLVATGHVKIIQGEREASCGRADLLPREDKIVLTDQPVVIDRGNDQTLEGERITMFRGERRVIVEKTHLVGPEIKDLGFDAREPAAKPASPAPEEKPQPQK
jgi:hypothetical protein